MLLCTVGGWHAFTAFHRLLDLFTPYKLPHLLSIATYCTVAYINKRDKNEQSLCIIFQKLVIFIFAMSFVFDDQFKNFTIATRNDQRTCTNGIQETQLSLTNRTTHLCKCNDVADLTSVIKIRLEKNDSSHADFRGHSKSFEPTWIDPPSMIFY